MTTLIILFDNKRYLGSCGAACYDSAHEKCTCICHGRNHGVGFRHAAQNTLRHAQKILEEHQRNQPPERRLWVSTNQNLHTLAKTTNH